MLIDLHISNILFNFALGYTYLNTFVMIYKVLKQVFDSKGNLVETSNFIVPCSFSEQLLRILISEGYTLFENDDEHMYLSMIKCLHDDCFNTHHDGRTYSRFIFRKVHGTVRN